MKAIKSFSIRYLLIILTCGTYSCDSDRIYESNVRIPSDGWTRSERARFEVEITDTTSNCNMYVNVRNTSEYKYMELWLFVDSHSPTGVVQRDTLKVMLADHRGKWLGNGLGDKFDNRMLFHQVRFPVSGTYVIEYEQAMRDEPLIGIEDVGLRIEKNH